ncbi:MAG TPA: hypothetical protein PK777_08935, partial [Thermoguttaceae bacterium]|nr:hypothetical protein [Thermoguttaceae bacterium]
MGEFETIQNRESHKSNGGQGTPSESPWTRLLRELQASLAEPEEQQQWDDLTLANYLAGLCTEQERTQIEQACQRSIELRMVIDSARMGLGLDQPTFAEEKPTPRSLRTGPVGSESVAPGLVSGGPTSGPGGRFPTWTLFRWIAVAAALAGVGFLGWLLAWETSRKTIGSLENQIASAQTQFQQKLQEHANLLDKTQQQATQHLQALQTDLQKRDQEIAKLKDSLAAQTDQLNRLEKELDVAQRRVPPIAAGQSAPAPPSGPSSRHEMFRPTIESAPKGQPQPSSWDTAGGPYPPSFPGYPGVSSATSVRGAPVILMPMYRLVQETMEANKIITMRPVLETSYREVVLPPDGNDTLPTLPWEMLLAGLSDPNDL